MTSPGIELLVRLVAEQLAAMRCEGCNELLSNPRVRPREHGADQVTFEVVCRACDRLMLLSVEPEAGEGVVSIR